MNDVIGIVVVIAVAMLSIFVYFAPSIIASKRNHPNQNAILVLNILLGWSFLGWVVALVWAYSAQPSAVSSSPREDSGKEDFLMAHRQAAAPAVQHTVQPVADDMRECPFCAETIKKNAKICRYCNRDLTVTKAAKEQIECPYCARDIDADSQRCPLCGLDLPTVADR